MKVKQKAGILRETKTPPDRRVPLIPAHLKKLQEQYPDAAFVVQKSDLRCYSDEEYTAEGVAVAESLEDCSVVLGVKEVHIPALMENKTYVFFSHTAKKQPYNRELLQEIIRKKIRLVDYEYLTDRSGVRLVAFGRWAGIVGAFNGVRGWGLRTGSFKLKPAHQCFDRKEMMARLKDIKLPPIRILITGGGRVAMGAMETLSALDLRKVEPEEFLAQTFEEPVVCRIDPDKYVRRKDGAPFRYDHFFAHPGAYESTFLPYTRVTDLYIPCHFWHPESPPFITAEMYHDPDFRIRLIADVSCDLLEPIASTLRASTIANPYYGYNPKTGAEDDPWKHGNITVMAVDNLPGELPRDASEEFGQVLTDKILPHLFGEDRDEVIKRATIAESGRLTERYAYLQDYLEGKE